MTLPIVTRRPTLWSKGRSSRNRHVNFLCVGRFPNDDNDVDNVASWNKVDVILVLCFIFLKKKKREVQRTCFLYPIRLFFSKRTKEETVVGGK